MTRPTQPSTAASQPSSTKRRRTHQVIDLTGSDSEDNLSRSKRSMPVAVREARSESVATEGPKKWKQDFAKAQAAWGKQGEVEGFAGMVATVKGELTAESNGKAAGLTDQTSGKGARTIRPVST